jgi:biopolymer transport protein ExbD
MASSSNNASALLTDINVTPLVDVVLVLLVIMMATATALASRTIPVQLPKASTGATPDANKPLTIAVDESGALFVEQTRVTDAELRGHARGRETAIVAADGRTRHESVVHALEVLRSEHVARISIVVRDAR